MNGVEAGNYIQEERLSFRELIEKFQTFFKYLISQWLKIGVVAIMVSASYFFYRYYKSPTYIAETTFVLDAGENGGGMGQLSSLASVVGVNLGGLGEDNGLFQMDNISALYSSRTMLKQAFLSSCTIDSTPQRLITRWAEKEKLIKKWRKKLNDPDFGFELPIDQFTIRHDSVLFAVIKDFRDKNLSVAKADRKQNILSVKINSKDQHFAKFFNQILVANVNEFYLQTKTKKSGDNLRILQQQADSVRRVLDGSLAEMARITDKTPNPNPMYLSSQVPVQKIKIDIQANAAIYEEIVKNLEITKLSHLNSRPLIQVVDAPEYPLPSDKLRPVKLIIQSILYGLLLSVVVFTIRYLYVSAIDENFQ